MPTYQYKCEKCEHVFEEIHKMADRHIPLTQPCPNCKEKECIEQMICASALISPLRLDGHAKPGTDFRERMKQIKSVYKNTSVEKNIKDY